MSIVTVYEVLRGSAVLKVFKSRGSAQRYLDRLDLEYGASVHWIRATFYFR